jgi:putative peptidoglycan lipid II flippase
VIAAFLPVGSVAALGFVEKLTSVPMMVFSSSLATVAFPAFAEQTGAGRFEELKATLCKTIRLAAVVLIPLSAACVAFAHPLVRLLFQRGNFGAASTDLIAATFGCSSLQFFFYTTNLLLVRAALALGEGLLLVKLTVIAVAVNTLANVALVLLLRPPVAGIALSTSLMAFLNALLLFLALRRRIGAMGGRRILDGAFRVAVVTLPATVGAWAVYRLLEPAVAHGPWLLQAAALGACMTASMVAVLLLCWRAGIEEVRSLGTAARGWLCP